MTRSRLIQARRTRGRLHGVTAPRANDCGDRLIAADVSGSARALRTVVVEGVTLAEGGAVLGVALGAPGDEGLVPVYVRAR